MNETHATTMAAMTPVRDPSPEGAAAEMVGTPRAVLLCGGVVSGLVAITALTGIGMGLIAISRGDTTQSVWFLILWQVVAFVGAGFGAIGGLGGRFRSGPALTFPKPPVEPAHAQAEAGPDTLETGERVPTLARALETRGLKPALKPFSLGQPERARALIERAGLTIEVFRTEDHKAGYPSARAFVEGVAAGAPATRHALAQLSEPDRAGFLADVEALLSAYADTDALRLPTRAHLILARR